MGDIDVADLLARVAVPTLVLHARGDMRCPFEEGRSLAAAIPGSRFVALESRNHLLLEHEPAWERFLRETRSFLGVDATPSPPAPSDGVAASDTTSTPLNDTSWTAVLRRARDRKLVQWALAYLATAWITLQVLGAVQEPWHLSEWLLQASQVILGMGFLLALVLGWYHGEKGEQRVTAPEALLIAGLLTITTWLLTALAP